MALTLRTNGSGGSNLVGAAWWNDYYNLLTGVMTDQIVTLKTDLIVAALANSPAAPSLALGSGTILGVGVYQYLYTYVDNNGGETTGGVINSITTTTNNQSVSITSITAGPTGTAKRNVYRTKAGLSTFLLLTTLNDNFTTTYTDNIADSSLVNQQPPGHPGFGGTILIRNGSNVTVGQIYSDGSIYFDGGKLVSDGAGNLTAQTASFSASTINTLALNAAATNGQGSRVARITNSSTSGTANADILDLSRTTTAPQTFTFGIDPSGLLYLYDVDNGLYVLQGLYAGHNVMTNRNGTQTAVAIYTGTGTPSNPPTGAIWIQA
jgi:hypothetical protein